MKEYHQAWLESHPQRTKEWLSARLSEGFDIHHIDGDHSNNASDNLVLIEAADHMRLHGMLGVDGRPLLRSLAGKKSKDRRALGKRAYEKALKIRSDSGGGEPMWRPISADMGISCSKVFSAARVWALENDLEWPLRHKSKGPVTLKFRPVRLGSIIPA